MANPTIVCNGKTVELTHETIPEPAVCPFCGGQVGRNQSGTSAITLCLNPECDKKTTGKIKRWAKALNILGIGDSVLEAMVEQCQVSTPADLYRLTVDELANMTISGSIRFGEARAEMLIAEINKTRELPLHLFMGSLGIKHLGRRRCEIMMENAPELHTIDGWRNGCLRNPDVAQRAGVPGTADEIQDGIDGMADVINQLLANGVSITANQPAEKIEATGLKLSGKKFVFTGKIEKCDDSGNRYTRDMMHQAVLLNGGLISDKVHKDTILVQADPNSVSSKSQKARTIGAQIMSEYEFWKLLS